MLFTASVQLKECDDAELYVSLLEEKGKLTADDLVNKACLQSSVNKSDDAILTYQKALKLNKTHVIALNNVGYELIEKGAHQVAQRALDKAIKLNPKFDHAYGNLGYSKILQDDLDVGKGLIDKCLQLNANNAEAFRALGIYYLKKKDIDQANANFNKATEIDKDIDVSKYTNEIKLLAEAKNAILGSAVSDAL
jgi:Flp pilus assembly protein TadD